MDAMPRRQLGQTSLRVHLLFAVALFLVLGVLIE
jgi:hypothetical protein